MTCPKCGKNSYDHSTDYCRNGDCDFGKESPRDWVSFILFLVVLGYVLKTVKYLF